jgi:hypothetical protein
VSRLAHLRRCFLGLVLVLGSSTRAARAQLRIAPYAAGALGISDIRTLFRIQTNPPTAGTFAQHSRSMLVGIGLGVEFGRHFAADARVRSTLGIGQPFRVLTLGPALRWGQGRQLQVRAGLGKVQGFQAVDCVASPSSCFSHYTSEWANGFDLAAAVDFPAGRRWSIGPELWWAQSVDGATRYRSMGLGAHLRYR